MHACMLFDEHNKYMKFGLHLILCFRHNTCLKWPRVIPLPPSLDKTLNFHFALTYTHKQAPPTRFYFRLGDAFQNGVTFT